MASARYWRVVGVDTYGGGDLDLSELHLYGTGGRVDAGAAMTSSHGPVSGALADLQDGSTATTARFSGADMRAGGFYIAWDCGSAVDVYAVHPGSASERSRYVASLALQYLDGQSWVTLGTYHYAWPGASTLPAFVQYDPGWYGVTALLHFNGAHNSTTIINEVTGGVAFTASGAAKISTAQSDLGGASLYLDGSTAYVTSAAGAAADLGVVSASTNFCFEFSIYATSVPGGQCVIAAQAVPGSSGSGRGGWGLTMIAGKLNFRISSINTSGAWIYGLITTNAVISAGVLTKVAVDIVAGVPSIRVNGVKVAQGLENSGGIWASSPIGLITTREDYGLRIGATSTDSGNPTVSLFLAAYIDELRITKGAVRHAVDYTPATVEFPPLVAAGQQAGPAVVRAAPPDGVAVVAASPGSAHSVPGALVMQTARDVEFGGHGTIYGTTKTKGAPNLPTKARVVLQHQRSKLPVRETWSDPVTGAFVFAGIDTSQQFLALAEDAAGHFRPVAANRLTPEVL